jgi:hypothetical protein
MIKALSWSFTICLHIIPLFFFFSQTQQPTLIAKPIRLSSIHTHILSPLKPKISKRLTKLKKKPTLSSSSKKTSENNDSYIYSILALFQEKLLLPESGLVKISLTINTQGQIHNLHITESKSAVNCRYLQEILPSLNLPPTPDKKMRSYALCFCDSM